MAGVVCQLADRSVSQGRNITAHFAVPGGWNIAYLPATGSRMLH
ncbi:hypothetical protein RNAN_2463 [Rheinheimera nanhaiensis E407-8]|uniref:Uncharacterized protein n=1 Tax=Rheinheimera nanhaiensis E407-8 TaxID=562729 RepID=I1DZH9_9GAMM|nr:hypothetical protein RNAN_2463 [Rheinheimera nanhaiensis E407-8]